MVFKDREQRNKHVPNSEDSESENEEVNDQLEDTFWCYCEQCQFMTTQRE